MKSMCLIRVFCSAAIALTLLANAVSAQTSVFGVMLTPEQGEQYKAINAAAELECKAVVKNAALSQDERNARLKTIYDVTLEKVKALLTPEQLMEMEKITSSPPLRTSPSSAQVKMYGVTLTPEQQEQFKGINAAADPAYKAVMKNAALSQAEKNMQMHAIYNETIEKLKALLTPEQLAEMAKSGFVPPSGASSRPAQIKMFGVTVTPEQEQQYKAINAAADPEYKAVMKDDSLSQAEKNAKLKAIYDGTMEKFKALLTPQQRKEMEASLSAQSSAVLPKPAENIVLGVTLTPEQGEQYNAITAAAELQYRAVMNNAGLQQAEKNLKLKAIHDETTELLKAIMTPEQLKEAEKTASEPSSGTVSKPAPIKMTP